MDIHARPQSSPGQWIEGTKHLGSLDTDGLPLERTNLAETQLPLIGVDHQQAAIMRIRHQRHGPPIRCCGSGSVLQEVAVPEQTMVDWIDAENPTPHGQDDEMAYRLIGKTGEGMVSVLDRDDPSPGELLLGVLSLRVHLGESRIW